MREGLQQVPRRWPRAVVMHKARPRMLRGGTPKKLLKKLS